LVLAQQFEQYLKSGSGHIFAKRHLGLWCLSRPSAKEISRTCRIPT
jgi:hypothetical protein